MLLNGTHCGIVYLPLGGDESTKIGRKLVSSFTLSSLDIEGCRCFRVLGPAGLGGFHHQTERESTARGGNKVGTLLRLDNRQNLARRRALGPARGFRCFRARHHCRRRKVCRGCNVNRELPKFTEVSALVYLLCTTHYLDDF